MRRRNNFLHNFASAERIRLATPDGGSGFGAGIATNNPRSRRVRKWFVLRNAPHMKPVRAVKYVNASVFTHWFRVHLRHREGTW